MSKFDDLLNNYVTVNEVNWQNMKNAAKTAGSHALDIATGGISTAVTDTIDAARGKDTGSQVDKLQSQVDQQATDMSNQAEVEAQTDAAHDSNLDDLNQDREQRNTQQDQTIQAVDQKVTGVEQRIGKVEQLMQQVQQQLGQAQQQPAATQPAASAPAAPAKSAPAAPAQNA